LPCLTSALGARCSCASSATDFVSAHWALSFRPKHQRSVGRRSINSLLPLRSVTSALQATRRVRTASIVTKLSRESSAVAAFEGLDTGGNPPTPPFVMSRPRLHGRGLFHLLFSFRTQVLCPSMRFLCFYLSSATSVRALSGLLLVLANRSRAWGSFASVRFLAPLTGLAVMGPLPRCIMLGLRPLFLYPGASPWHKILKLCHRHRWSR
jgi:hypothetical protein